MNIIIFGPNGSGKGTQGEFLKENFKIPHIESGVIFRENINNNTKLGKKAKLFIDKGNLVPDDVTIPMVLNKLENSKGWILDGFPRTLNQAEKLVELGIDYLIEFKLSREIAKKRIMGRLVCSKNGNHPNNVNVSVIKPKKIGDDYVCRICGGELSSRDDDQDEKAIDKRHDIYYDEKDGTLAAISWMKERFNFIELDARPSVEEIKKEMFKKIKKRPL